MISIVGMRQKRESLFFADLLCIEKTGKLLYCTMRINALFENCLFFENVFPNISTKQHKLNYLMRTNVRATSPHDRQATA